MWKKPVPPLPKTIMSSSITSSSSNDLVMLVDNLLSIHDKQQELSSDEELFNQNPQIMSILEGYNEDDEGLLLSLKKVAASFPTTTLTTEEEQPPSDPPSECSSGGEDMYVPDSSPTAFQNEDLRRR